MRFAWRGEGREVVSRRNEGRSAWTVVVLLFLFMMINFADKVVLALAAVPVMDEFSLTPTRFGLLGSSFYLLFAVAAVATGFIVNHAQTRWAILAMALIWSLAQLSVIGATGFAFLMTSRIVLGAGEGPAYPIAVHAVYKWFRNERRAVPTAIVLAGAGVGLVVAPPALTYVVAHTSWRWAFGVLGMVGLLWALVWLPLGAEGMSGSAQEPRDGAHVSYARLLFNGTALATFASGFGASWGSALLFAWFTPYLIKGLGFPLSEAGWLTSLPALTSLVVIGIGAWVSQAAVAHGATTRVARGTLTGTAALLGGIAMMLTPDVTASAAKVALISLGIGLPTLIFVLSMPMIGEFTPVRQRGAMLAITNSIWTAAGAIAPYVMGRTIEGGATAAQGYEHGFFVCGIVTSVCGAIGLIFLRPQAELIKFSRVDGGSPRRGSVAREIGRG
jgi:MFS transporter, ACS family, D-galactonate transporter